MYGANVNRGGNYPYQAWQHATTRDSYEAIPRQLPPAPMTLRGARPHSSRGGGSASNVPLFSSIREYKLAFAIMRNDNQSVETPEIRDDDSIVLIDGLYRSIRRRVRRSNIILCIRLGVVGICFMVEFIGARALGLEGTEFTMSQIKNMHMYEPMIDEFCKQYRLDEESTDTGEVAPWPIEIRFSVTVFMNFIIFYAGKVLTSNGDILSMIAKVAGAQVADSAAPSAADSPLSAVRSLFGGLGSIIQPLMSFVTGMQRVSAPMSEPILNPVYNDND